MSRKLKWSAIPTFAVFLTIRTKRKINLQNVRHKNLKFIQKLQKQETTEKNKKVRLCFLLTVVR
jgi:hypothetical protein